MGKDLTVLVGDAGGSNTRLALAGPEIGVTALKSFSNNSYASLEEVLEAYCAQPEMPDLHGACIAVAGPVQGGAYRLTNRDWQGTAAGLESHLNLAPGGRAAVINDLAALGHSLPVLMPGQLNSLRAGRQRGSQALVAGIGTGFNVSLSADSHTVQAEMGHASLPQPVHAALAEMLARAPQEFSSVEELFSGRGFVRFHNALTGETAEDGAQIVAAFGDGAGGAAEQAVTAWARLLGLFARELVPAYMPGQGLFFAGSVARGVLGTGARENFLAAFSEPAGKMDAHCAEVPLWLITDDAAGVSGAARYAIDAVLEAMARKE
ncbi:glucokinase [Roseobacteraceae bacterium NS-SX3]